MTVPFPRPPTALGAIPALLKGWLHQLWIYVTQDGAEGGGLVRNTRNINTTAPITGGGDLSADRTLALAAAGITNAYLAVMANNTVKGNVSGGSTVPTDLTATQLTTLVNSFTSVLSGAVPASGGGTDNLLRADGTWTDTTTGKLVAGTYVKTGITVVASLPAAATAGSGAQYFVTDSTVAAAGNFGAIVAGGGANLVPVWCDATNWRIG